MNKKFLALLIILVIASISTASAFDLNSLFSGSSSDNSAENNVTVCEIDFIIPDGFEEVKNVTVDNENVKVYDDAGYNLSSKTFMNKDQVIILSVSQYDVPMDLKAIEDITEDGNKTTINGVDGIITQSPGFYEFSFDKDGKYVIISATDKELFNDIKVA